jgi:hypothetical protein
MHTIPEIPRGGVYLPGLIDNGVRPMLKPTPCVGRMASALVKPVTSLI